MRDYLSPAKRVMSQTIARTLRLKFVGTKKNMLVSAGVASLVAVSLVAFTVVRTNASQNSSHSNNAVITTKTTVQDAVVSQPQEAADVSVQEEQPMTTQSSSNDSRSTSDTKVTINNENIPVPENGTVHRTIQNENGTTNVTVNTNTGTTSNQSSSSTSMNVNTSTFSRSSDVNISSQ